MFEHNGTVHHLFINSEKAYDKVRREVLYNILIECGIPTKLIRLIKLSSNETCSEFSIGKNLFDAFRIQNDVE
jgi:hypothetical protein